MNIELRQGDINIVIKSLGCELISYKVKGVETLWQGDPQIWSGQSPQLFPVIGSMPSDKWLWKGQEIHLGNHGFARHSEFKLCKQSENEVEFVLESDKETLKAYPFLFSLFIKYTLCDNRLKISYRVSNQGEEEMPFSLGAHPGFICPLGENISFEDYFLEFNHKETIERRLKERILTGETAPSLIDSDKIVLDYSLFDDCALIYSGLKSDQIILKNRKNNHRVKMNFKGFPDFGIWTQAKKNGAYICLEPWFGVDSTEGDSSDFSQKEGLVYLKAGENFDCLYSFEVTL